MSNMQKIVAELEAEIERLKYENKMLKTERDMYKSGYDVAGKRIMALVKDKDGSSGLVN